MSKTTGIEDLIRIVLRYRWSILIILGIFTLVGLAEYWRKNTPVFQGNMMLQVSPAPAGGVGNLGAVAAQVGGITRTNSEVEIIRSRAVVGETVDILDLDYSVQYIYLPYIGKAIYNAADADSVQRSAWFGLNKYAWGGEQVTIESAKLPENSSVLIRYHAGDQFSVIVDGRVVAADVDVGQIAQFKMLGQPAEIAFKSIRAYPGLEFFVKRADFQNTVGGMQYQFIIQEMGERSGILQVGLVGQNPEKIANTLDTLADVYVRRSIEKNSDRIMSRLNFVQRELPGLKAKLDAAEKNILDYRQSNETVNLTTETAITIQQITEIEKQITELKFEGVELRRDYREKHPRVLAWQRRYDGLLERRQELLARVRQVPETEQELESLQRDYDIANAQYSSFLRSVQDLDILEGDTAAVAAVIDYAYVRGVGSAAFRQFIIIFSVGLVLALTQAILRSRLNKRVEDAFELEKGVGLKVLQSLPYSRLSKLKSVSADQNDAAKYFDPALEAIRGLRVSLDTFYDHNEVCPTVVVTSATPNVGKSFLISNLAKVYAESNARVLVIDADVYRLHQKDLIGTDDVSSKSLQVDELGYELSVALNVSRHSKIELLEIKQFKDLPVSLEKIVALFLSKYSKDYDMVLIDTPPVFAAHEAVALSTIADMTLLMAMERVNTIKQVQYAAKAVQQVSDQVHMVLNSRSAKGSNQYLANYYYSYHS